MVAGQPWEEQAQPAVCLDVESDRASILLPTQEAAAVRTVSTREGLLGFVAQRGRKLPAVDVQFHVRPSIAERGDGVGRVAAEF